MTNKKFLILTLLVSSLLFISCSDEPSSIGSGLLGPDEIVIEQVNSYTDSISQTSSTRLIIEPLGSSSRLLLGRHANVEASFLIRFAIGLPDSVKQDLINNLINVTSAQIRLTRVYTFGNNSGVLDINIERVLNSWSSNGFTSDSLPNLQTTVIAIDSLSITDSTSSFKFDNSVALEWLKFAADPALGSNWGLYLKPGPSADKIFGFQALISAASNVPGLELIINKPGVYTDTLNYIPNADISVLKNIIPFPSGEYMTIQSGLNILSYLNYDITVLPPFAVINKAELLLTSDTTLNISGDINNKIAAYIPADTTKLDSIGSAIVEFERSGNIFSANITTFVQDWLVSKNNRGLVLTTSNSLNGLERYVLWNSSAADSALRPRLVITYTNKL